MKDSESVAAAACDFEKSYEQARLPAVRELERSVLGCDYGGTSWTTRSQADDIGTSLDLGPGVHLLEVGAGSGWPGLFLAQATGCNVTLVDLPFNALQLAIERAVEDGIEQRSRAVAASGAALPFNDGSFDAVGHSDVLCCMPEKSSMLQECRRVLRPGGKMLFSVIAPAPSLSESDYKEALEAGPPFVEVPGNYASMLRDSGWQVLEIRDVTEEYLQSLRTLVESMIAMQDAVTEALGIDEYQEQLERRQFQVVALDRGLLVREIYVTRTA